MEGTARTRPDILKVVFGPYVQYCPCEASEQKLGQKPESELKDIKLSYCHHSICLKIGRKMTELCPFNVLVPKLHLAYLCQLMAILAKLLDMDFKFLLPSIHINFNKINFEVNQTQISPAFFGLKFF